MKRDMDVPIPGCPRVNQKGFPLLGVFGGKYKTWIPGPWTPSVDRIHGPGPSKYGPGPWTPFMDRVHRPPIFTTPKITEVNKNKIKSKVKL